MNDGSKSAAASARSAGDDASERSIIVVDLGKRQSEKRIKQLRKGRGKLVGKIHSIVDELDDLGRLSAGGDSPVVVVVLREAPSLPWPFS